MESLHLQMLADETPENERVRMDPDHWYELNLTNAFLFANLAPENVQGMEQLVPGRLFTTRMPRDLNDASQDEGADFIKKCKKNNLKVVFDENIQSEEDMEEASETLESKVLVLLPNVNLLTVS